MLGHRNAELDAAKARTTRNAPEMEDSVVEQALRNFRLSVHAWSESVHHRPLTVAREVRHRSWRLAAGLALSVALTAGSFGVVHERNVRHEEARQAAAARLAAEQRAAAAQQARAADRELLTNVDSDVSREVPSAMEPLAQLMDVSDTN